MAFAKDVALGADLGLPLGGPRSLLDAIPAQSESVLRRVVTAACLATTKGYRAPRRLQVAEGSHGCVLAALPDATTPDVGVGVREDGLPFEARFLAGGLLCRHAYSLLCSSRCARYSVIVKKIGCNS